MNLLELTRFRNVCGELQDHRRAASGVSALRPLGKLMHRPVFRRRVDSASLDGLPDYSSRHVSAADFSLDF